MSLKKENRKKNYFCLNKYIFKMTLTSTQLPVKSVNIKNRKMFRNDYKLRNCEIVNICCVLFNDAFNCSNFITTNKKQ